VPVTAATHFPEVLLVRHGETEWSRSGKHTGRTDVPLTPLGRQQGQAIATQLVGRKFGRVLTSPLQRAVETVRLAGVTDAVVDPDLAEWDYGSYEGRTTAEIRAGVTAWSLWRDGAPGGEVAADVGRRVDRVIASIRLEARDTLVFAHGHVLRVMAARWIGLPAVEGRCFALDTATVSVLGWEREVPVMARWNDPCHLLALPAVE
jgi:probable phosphoglycerate mutase